MTREERDRIGKLIKEHQKILRMLENSAPEKERWKKQAEDSAKAIRERRVNERLMEISVKELRTGRNASRIRLLEENGYHSVGSVLSTRTGRLAEIDGISEDGARALKAAAREIREQTAKKIPFRLDPRQHSPEEDRLVLALSCFGEAEILRETCRNLEDAYGSQVRKALTAVRPLQGTLRGLFAGSAGRRRAAEALAQLQQLLDGDYGAVARKTEKEYSALRKRTPEEAWKRFETESPVFYACLERLAPELRSAEETYYGLPAELGEPLKDVVLQTEGLHATLRGYQEMGVKYILQRKKVLLGDEMGLGKTIQAIAAMVSLHNSGATHFLILCPAGVLVNWCREIRRFSDLEAFRVHGKNRDEEWAAWKKQGGAAVTTYETAAFLELQYNDRLDFLIADEAHYLKNPKTRRSQTAAGLCFHTDRILFLTGTPMENRPEEMAELIRYLNPELAAILHADGSRLSAFAFRLAAAPVYYRRKREDVLQELPELVENEEWCIPGREEWERYRETLEEGNWMEVRRVSWNAPIPAEGCKAERLRQLLQEAAEDGRKILVFSFFLDTLRTVCEIAGENCFGPITGSVPAPQRQKILDEFEQATDGAVLAAQIQSGGTGLNIQCASTVIFCEPQLKPSLETQAVSRAYRMGQTRTVMVHRLLCEDTIDERIRETLQEKQELFDRYADRSAAAELERLAEKLQAGLLKREQERVLRAPERDLREADETDKIEKSNEKDGIPQ